MELKILRPNEGYANPGDLDAIRASRLGGYAMQFLDSLSAFQPNPDNPNLQAVIQDDQE